LNQQNPMLPIAFAFLLMGSGLIRTLNESPVNIPRTHLRKIIHSKIMHSKSK
jgi:hypothetical protein